LDAVTPGLTLGTLYSSGVGINKTKQHTHAAAERTPLTRPGSALAPGPGTPDKIMIYGGIQYF